MAQSGRIAAIFKRGGQKPEHCGSAGASDGAENGRQLEQHLQQLAQAWAAPKVKKGLAVAVWRPALGAFEVISKGRQVFNGQGFMHNKKLYLNVEEAVYLLDRAVTLLLLEKQQQQQQEQTRLAVEQQLLSTQEALHMMAGLCVHHDRLLVVSHLSRLGYTIRRHPACWLVPPDVSPCSIWQTNPAWASTDGLPTPQPQPPPAAAAQPGQATPALAETVVAAAAAPGMPGATPNTHQQPQLLQGQQQQQQQEQQRQEQQQQQVDELPTSSVLAVHNKRRRIAAAAPPEENQVGAAGEAGSGDDAHMRDSSMHWYAAAPAWLGPAQQLPPTWHQNTATNNSSSSSTFDPAAAAQSQQQHQGQLLLPVLPGVELQKRFPLLVPLQRYRDGREQQQQQEQQPQQQGHKQEEQRVQERPFSEPGIKTADLVFDALLTVPHFSYKAPPTPQFSIAMMRNGCTDLPPLDEILDLSAAAAPAQTGPTPLSTSEGAGVATGGTAAVSIDVASQDHRSIAAGAASISTGLGGTGMGSNTAVGSAAAVTAACDGDGSDGHKESGSDAAGYDVVRFALPEEGEISFCDLVPVKLMNLLTNR